MLVAMLESRSGQNHKVNPPRLLPVLERVKQSYLLWHEYHSTLQKLHRYTLGGKIDTLFIEAIEALCAAVFLGPDEKLPYVRLSVRNADPPKLLLFFLSA